MGRAKIPRKSTIVDMTAMCDVAFLLLTFFILATKQKPPEAVTVEAPTSVQSKAAPEKNILVTLNKDGKCFLLIGEDTKKKEILADLNTTRQIGLNEAELKKLAKLSYYGMPIGQMKSILALNTEVPADKLDGIPITDTANNELVYWVRSITNAYAGGDQNALQEKILIKGDINALYPAFKNVKYALKKNEILKFKIVTNSENVPAGSELYNKPIGKDEVK